MALTRLVVSEAGTWATVHLASTSVGLERRTVPSVDVVTKHTPNHRLGEEAVMKGVATLALIGTCKHCPVEKVRIIFPCASVGLSPAPAPTKVVLRD